VPTPAPERFDRSYFDLWYRRRGFGDRARLERRVAYALGAAEHLLGRPVTSVLDVGCGEGPWQPVLSRHRPGMRYVGVDPSTYAVERFGRRRDLRLGGFGDIDQLVPIGEGPFDLIVSVDVLGYVGDAEVRRGVQAIADRLVGVAFLEAFTTADPIVGDVDGYRRRRASTYVRWFAAAGLHRVGPNLYVGSSLRPFLAALEGPLDH
jgi:SAM-dependent methyltransferase